MEQNIPGQRQGVTAALAAAQARTTVASSVNFPREDEGEGLSLADMAQRDLDSALQLLADRAQYITGATGAAIALRRDGRDYMLCRASVGSNAPELGALISTEIGLSGESVRTRRLQRCDDAERDVRVNREICRLLGIASVLVMPVVNDKQVLGVFELFSGKANAFGERDLSAVQRLSQMVEAAVRLASASDHLPEQQLSEQESSVPEKVHAEVFEDQLLEDLVVEEEVPSPPETQSVATKEAVLESSATATIPGVTETGVTETGVTEISPKAKLPELREEGPAVPAVPAVEEGPAVPAVPAVEEGSVVPAAAAVSVPASVPAVPVHKPLSQSSAVGEAEAIRGGTDQSRVPPVLRGLRRCEACGFPISAGRLLCTECEEKKWRALLWSAPARKPPAGVSEVPDGRKP